MVRKITWAHTAIEDLEETAAYISRDSHYYAKAFVSEIKEAVRSLSILSERGRIVPELNDDTIRELFVRNYRLIYLIDGNEVRIIGLIHGARDLSKMWDR